MSSSDDEVRTPPQSELFKNKLLSKVSGAIYSDDGSSSESNYMRTTLPARTTRY